MQLANIELGILLLLIIQILVLTLILACILIVADNVRELRKREERTTYNEQEENNRL